MKKMLLCVIVSFLWLIGCSKENPLEPITKPPVDTTHTTDTIPSEFTYNVKCSSLFYDGVIKDSYLYILPKEPINIQLNIKCDSIILKSWKDSINYSLTYYPTGGGKVSYENENNPKGGKVRYFTKL